MAKHLLTFIDPEQVVRVYFYRDTSASTSTALQVSWDNGVSWADLAAGPDKDGVAAFRVDLIGPDVSSPPPGKVLLSSRNYGIIRHVDNPEITPFRFHVDVKPRAS